MKWIKRILKDKRMKYKPCEPKLLIIDDTADLMHEILGISDKRAHELLMAADKAYNDHDKLHLCIEELVAICVHTNEVVFTTMVLQKIIDQKNATYDFKKAVAEFANKSNRNGNSND
jgi:hypothetical protein